MNLARQQSIRAEQAAVRALKRVIGGIDRNSRRKYIRDYHRDFARFSEPASYDDLLVRGFRSDIVYIGDYHALPECQIFCARFLRDMIRRSEKVVLAVEMIFSRQQRILDEWMQRALSDAEFLRRIRYQEEWGYDWNAYREVLETAREAGIPAIGIDCDPRSGFRMIRRRDAHAAGHIAEHMAAHPGSKIVVFVGESHLARNHLPFRVQQEMHRRQMEARDLTIVQNVDALYWQRAEEELDRVDVVRVDEGRYCVFNATPLAKYEGYRRTLERWSDQDGEDDIDLTPTVYSMIETILRFLKIDRYRHAIPQEDGSHLRLADVFPEIYTHEEPDLVREMLLRNGLDEESTFQVLGHLQRAGSCYVPAINSIFVGTFDLTHAGEEASHFINSALSGELYEGWNGAGRADHERFYGEVLAEALGYFGSKLIDPARNHFFETDFYRYYGKDREVIESRTGYSFDDFRAIIDFILLHKKFERDYRAHNDVPETILQGIRSTGDRFRILTHELGYFLGQQMYDGFHQGLVNRKDLLALYKTRWGSTDGSLSTYLDWSERLAPLATA